jgi:hypothetical protein
MGRHGKELTTEQKEILLSLSHQGFSSYKIQELTGINCRTIQKFLKDRKNSLRLDSRFMIRPHMDI